MKIVMASIFAGFFLQPAFAGDVKVCRDGQYMVSVPAESVDFVEGVFKQASNDGQLAILKQRPQRASMLYDVQLTVASGLEALKLIKDKDGVIIECNSLL